MLLEVFLDPEKQLPAGYLYRLSDLNQADLQELQDAWPDIPAWRRIAVLEEVEEIGEDDYTLSYEALARFCMGDSEPRVRELAVQTLWDYELPDLIPAYIDMLEKDESSETRSAATTALGKYIYLGEIEELAPSILKEIEDKLIGVINGKDASLVRRRALEAMGFSSRGEVKDLILNAFYSGKPDWLMSALYAMGRSANKSWKSMVLEMFSHDNPEVVAEAIRTAGELEIKEAAAALLEYLDNDDREVRMAAIWALSQIGGEGVQDALEALYEESDDAEEVDLLEAAFDNLAFTEDMELFALLDFAEDDQEDDGLFDEYEDDGDLLH